MDPRSSESSWAPAAVDGKSFAIGILSVTACVLFVGLLIVTMLPTPAQAIGTSDKGGDYIMLTQQLTSSQEGVVVIDVASQRLAVYAYDINRKQLVPMSGFTLDRLRTPGEPDAQRPPRRHGSAEEDGEGPQDLRRRAPPPLRRSAEDDRPARQDHRRHAGAERKRNHAGLALAEALASSGGPAPPVHVAIIMDGNGRWAELRGLPRMAGHTEGIKSVREIITLCRDLGIGALTIYAFSQENWKRPIPEINALMLLLEQYLQSEMDALIEKGARFRAIGRVNSLPPSALNWVRKVERETAHLDKLMLTVALSYGGRSEIVDAVRRLAEDCKAGTVQPDQIDEPLLESYLSTQGLPDPDLLIRTSGEARISNFLLWQLAYTEMYFTPTLWPDFRRREALIALLEFQQRERRFGQVPGAGYPPSGL